ncbi:Deoxycytidine monophosphate (dCMP) deaminase [Cryptotrichosporon argae]
MFIALVGTPSAGKHTVLDYLVRRHGFQQVGLEAPRDPMDAAQITSNELDEIKGLSMSEHSTPAATPGAPPTFRDAPTLLDYITRNWLARLVTVDLRTHAELDPFVKRPSFLLVAVDGPLRTRYEREQTRSPAVLSLDAFIDQHDTLLNGAPATPASGSAAASSLAVRLHPQTDFRRVLALAQLTVCNNFPSVAALEAHLDALDLLDGERLRPGWDMYFMTLASLASRRSNCMKRRVGALLIRSKRILSTGYNGTPRGVRNCNEGGCARCNGSARGGEALNECLCLHAEENALLEAGKDRIGDDAVLYCNTCPCLRCSVKIVQCGVREVVYNQSYSMDEASAAVLKEGGVVLRQFHMPP